jgi:hypothetical protein
VHSGGVKATCGRARSATRRFESHPNVALAHVLYAVVLFSTLLLFAPGCAYYLRYIVESSQLEHLGGAALSKTFALSFPPAPLPVGSYDRDRANKEGLLSILSRSLTEAGWERVSASEAAYIFSVDFLTGDRTISGEVEFRVPSYRFGYPGLQPMPDAFREEGRLSPAYISIEAARPGRENSFVWAAECTIPTGNQDIVSLGSHIIPFAVSKFPEEGAWSMRQKVRLHGASAP